VQAGRVLRREPTDDSRARRFEERAATAIDPRTREHWQRVSDAWNFAADCGCENVKPSTLLVRHHHRARPGSSTRGVGGDAGVATRQESREFGLCPSREWERVRVLAGDVRGRAS
jgi:hypothetical protein